MDKTPNKEEIVKNYQNGMVHFILVHSYLIFLFSIILGVFFDTFLKEKMYSSHIFSNIGILMLILGTILIYWAQKTSSNYQERKITDEKKSIFEFGPYQYSRSPTHFGLFIMALGFSLIINSLFSIIFTILAYIITKLFFLRKEEKILEKKYGEIYTDYKKKIKNWV